MFALRNAKTAHGVIAYAGDLTVAVIDPEHAGKRVRDVVPYLASDAPIVATVAEAIAFAPTSLLVGVAPAGGELPRPGARRSWRRSRRAWRSSAGCTTSCRATRSSRRAAQAVRLTHLGRPHAAAGARVQRRGIRHRVARRAHGRQRLRRRQDDGRRSNSRAPRAERGEKAAFVATGQTGIMIAGWGTAIDRVISDFASRRGRAARPRRVAPRRSAVRRRTGRHQPSGVCAGDARAALRNGARRARARPQCRRAPRSKTTTRRILSYRTLIRTLRKRCARP